MSRRAILVALAALTAGTAAYVPAASAQSGAWPTRAIRWVVPYPAGSPVDVSTRRIADSVSARLGQTVVLENRPGAYGSIGAAEVARAAPDGYTMLATIQDPLIAATATVKSLPYDPTKDFKFLVPLTLSGPVVVIHPKYPVNNVRELAEYAKTAKQPMSYGSWGPGSIPAVLMETFAKMAGVQFQEIQYRGSPPAMQDLMGDQIAFTLTAAHIAAPLAAAGKMKVIGIFGPKRAPKLPNVPTFVESGYDNLVMRSMVWTGLLAPAALPASIADRTVEATRAALNEPAVRNYLIDSAYEIPSMSPAEFEKMFRDELAVVPKIIRDDLKVLPQ